jgi:hypothetical protein
VLMPLFAKYGEGRERARHAKRKPRP